MIASEVASSMGGLLGLGFEGLGIDSIMGMGPLGMGIGGSSGLGVNESGERGILDDRSDGSVLGPSRLSDGGPFGLSTSGTSQKRHGDQSSQKSGQKRLSTVNDDNLDDSDGNDAADEKPRKQQRESQVSTGQTREKSTTVTGGSGMGGIGRTSTSGAGRLRSYSAAESGLTTSASSVLMSPTSMSPSSPAVASPSSSYLFTRDESIPAPRSCGVCFGVGTVCKPLILVCMLFPYISLSLTDGLVAFRSFASGDSSTQALLSSRTYADLRRCQLESHFSCVFALTSGMVHWQATWISRIFDSRNEQELAC